MIKFAAAIAFAIVATTLAADGPQTDWPSYNRTLTSERYASLDQINRANVSKLKQLCVYDLRIDSSFQTGPIVIGRTMYATTDKEILAIDAATCQLTMTGALSDVSGAERRASIRATSARETPIACAIFS